MCFTKKKQKKKKNINQEVGLSHFKFFSLATLGCKTTARNNNKRRRRLKLSSRSIKKKIVKLMKYSIFSFPAGAGIPQFALLHGYYFSGMHA
jgi:hypothetical protein